MLFRSSAGVLGVAGVLPEQEADPGLSRLPGFFLFASAGGLGVAGVLPEQEADPGLSRLPGFFLFAHTIGKDGYFKNNFKVL